MRAVPVVATVVVVGLTVADGVPPDRREQVHRWDRLHHGRGAVIVAAFVLLVVAAAG